MFSDPEKNVRELFLQEGMNVADLGAGSGAYTIAAARKVGDDGRVYAIEVQKDLVAKIKAEASNLHVDNVEVLWGDIEKLGGTKIADASVDAVILSNILFQVDDRVGVMKEAHRILKTRGKILIVDWLESFGGLGPQPSDILSEIDAKNLLGDAGFAYENNIEAGEYHYGFIASKP